MEILYHKNDNLLEIRDANDETKGLKNEATGEYINNATVTARVKDKNEVDVTGQSWPLSLTYVQGTDGVYRGTLEAALNVQVGDRITVEVTATATGGLEGFWKVPTIVRQRGKIY